MVYLNSSSKSRNAGSIITQNQGGGNKKAGLVHQVGKTSWSYIFLGQNIPSGNCCTVAATNTTPFLRRNVSQSRGVGSIGNAQNTYWKIPGI